MIKQIQIELIRADGKPGETITRSGVRITPKTKMNEPWKDLRDFVEEATVVPGAQFIVKYRPMVTGISVRANSLHDVSTREIHLLDGSNREISLRTGSRNRTEEEVGQTIRDVRSFPDRVVGVRISEVTVTKG